MRTPTSRFAAGTAIAFALTLSGFIASDAAVRGPQPRAAFATGAVAPVVQPYTFMTLDDPADPTFNQLLGVNNEGVVVGYYGSGAAGHPNRGYRLEPPYTKYQNENYPGAVQTQVVGINLNGNTAGFWVDGSGNNFGFVQSRGAYRTYKNPKTTGTVNQLLALNRAGVAVGFYTDASGVNHGYTVDSVTNKYVDVTPPNATNVTAAGINNNDDVVGYYTATGGAVVGFVRSAGTFHTFTFPKATATTPFGINDSGTIVGSYLDAAGASHGFIIHGLLTPQARFRTLDVPKGIGTSVITHQRPR